METSSANADFNFVCARLYLFAGLCIVRQYATTIYPRILRKKARASGDNNLESYSNPFATLKVKFIERRQQGPRKERACRVNFYCESQITWV